MNKVTKRIKVTHDFCVRFVKNFVQQISTINSGFYLRQDENSVSGKSIIGLLSAKFEYGDIIDVVVYNNSVAVAERDMHTILEMLGCGVIGT